MTGLKNKEFMQLYESYHKDLSNFCNSLNYDRHEAKELMSETIVRALEGFDKLKKKSSFKSYLFSIAINIRKENLRKKNRVIPMRGLVQKGDTQRAEDYTIKQILAQLPQEQAEVFLLFEIVDMSLTEIAETLDSNLSTAKTRQSRARKKLKELLATEFNQHISNF